MQDLSSWGRILIVLGGLTVLLGLFLVFMPKIPFIGRLPGDIYLSRKNFTFYFPLATSILVSIVLSLFMWLGSKK